MPDICRSPQDCDPDAPGGCCPSDCPSPTDDEGNPLFDRAAYGCCVSIADPEYLHPPAQPVHTGEDDGSGGPVGPIDTGSTGSAGGMDDLDSSGSGSTQPVGSGPSVQPDFDDEDSGMSGTSGSR